MDINDINEEKLIENNNKPPRRLIRSQFMLGLVTGVVFIICILVLILFTNYINKSDKFYSLETQNKINLIKSYIDQKYYDDYDDDKLNEGLYKGLVSGLNDPYSLYYDKEETKELNEISTGNYSGIGASFLVDKDGKLIINEVFKNSPASDVGLQKNDILIKVADKDIKNQDLSKVVSQIKGKDGTRVKLTIIRDDNQLDFTLTRKKIDIESVKYEIKENEMGYIKITEFSNNTYDQFKLAYDDLNNKNIKSLIIDLRDNPGGSVKSLISILDEMLPRGLLFYTKDKNGKVVEYKSTGDDTINIPLAVLVNNNSASASEIFAGAIKDRKVGKVIGTKTYGKGVINEMINLGDKTTLRLTIAKYFTPNGIDINGKGIEPDVNVELSEDIDNQLSEAIKYLNTQEK